MRKRRPTMHCRRSRRKSAQQSRPAGHENVGLNKNILPQCGRMLLHTTWQIRCSFFLYTTLALYVSTHAPVTLSKSFEEISRDCQQIEETESVDMNHSVSYPPNRKKILSTPRTRRPCLDFDGTRSITGKNHLTHQHDRPGRVPLRVFT